MSEKCDPHVCGSNVCGSHDDKVADCGSCHDEACSHRLSNRSEKMKSSLVSRLNRIEGQIRGIKGMIEKDAYCDDVLNQIASAQAAMNSVSKLLLENHMKSCIVNRIQSGDMEVIDEVLKTIEKMMK